MNKIKDRIIPLALVTIGIYLTIIPYFLRFNNDILYSLIPIVSQTLIIVGLLFYVVQLLMNRFSKIEEYLEMNRNDNINNISLIPSDNYISFVEQIKKIKYVYKASIYIPNAQIESLFFVKSLITSVRIDSSVRILLNINNGDINALKNMESVIINNKTDIDFREIDSPFNTNFFIVVLDTKIWILSDFGKDIKSSLLFSISSYDAHGKSFIDMYNQMWNESKKTN